jgi:hypothetical protein
LNATLPGAGPRLPRQRLFTAFKYIVYGLLALNILFWFREDFAASAETFHGAVNWRNVVEAFSSTIDTVAWVVLLLLFELETAVIPEEKLRGGLKWALGALTLVCYFFIVYSFYGYCVKFGMIAAVEPFVVDDVCALVGGDWNVIASLDDYPALDAATCHGLQGRPLARVSGTDILATPEAYALAWRLAVVDIVNAGTWLIVVVLLEIELLLQLRDRLSDRMIRVGKYAKGFFYAVLFGCAAYWGLDGSFLDFWDAFLWLVAFVFIELNIFRWHEAEEDGEAAPA